MPYTNRRHTPRHTEPKRGRNRRQSADTDISCLILALIILTATFLSAHGYAYISGIRTMVSAYGA